MGVIVVLIIGYTLLVLAEIVFDLSRVGETLADAVLGVPPEGSIMKLRSVITFLGIDNGVLVRATSFFPAYSETHVRIIACCRGWYGALPRSITLFKRPGSRCHCVEGVAHLDTSQDMDDTCNYIASQCLWWAVAYLEG